jgi:uracil-DNA glycosylase
VIRLISKHNDGCAFLLWGNYGKKKETLIDTKKHAVIKSGHPSPFSVNLFFNSKCFSKANEFLTKKNKKPINWSLN